MDALDFSIVINLDANGALSLDDDATGPAIRQQVEIATPEAGLQVGLGGRTPPTVADIKRCKSNAVDTFAIEIRGARMLQPLARLDESGCDRRGAFYVRDRYWAALSAVGVSAI